MSIFREHHFEYLSQLVGHPEWCGDPRFETREGWAENTDSVIRPAVETWATDKTRLEACQELCGHGIAAGPSNLASDLVNDEHVAQRDMLIEVPRSDAEKPMLVAGNPVKLSRVEEGPIRRFPSLGQHTAEVLQNVLGIDDEELRTLSEDGVVSAASD